VWTDVDGLAIGTGHTREQRIDEIGILISRVAHNQSGREQSNESRTHGRTQLLPRVALARMLREKQTCMARSMSAADADAGTADEAGAGAGVLGADSAAADASAMGASWFSCMLSAMA
jgi:hypothetical protein